MKVKLKEPIIVEDKIYEFAHISVSMSTGFSNPEEYTFAFRAVPYRINENNEVEKLEDVIISHSYLNVLNSTVSDIGEGFINNVQELLNK